MQLQRQNTLKSLAKKISENEYGVNKAKRAWETNPSLTIV